MEPRVFKGFFKKDEDRLVRIVLLVVIVVSSGPLIVWLFIQGGQDDESRRILAELNHEVELIGKTQRSVLLHQSGLHGTGKAYVTASYRIKDYGRDVFAFFDKAIVRQHWQFVEGDDVNWKDEVVETKRRYCKGRHMATISCKTDEVEPICELTLHYGLVSLFDQLFGDPLPKGCSK